MGRRRHKLSRLKLRRSDANRKISLKQKKLRLLRMPRSLSNFLTLRKSQSKMRLRKLKNLEIPKKTAEVSETVNKKMRLLKLNRKK